MLKAEQAKNILSIYRRYSEEEHEIDEIVNTISNLIPGCIKCENLEEIINREVNLLAIDLILQRRKNDALVINVPQRFMTPKNRRGLMDAGWFLGLMYNHPELGTVIEVSTESLYN